MPEGQLELLRDGVRGDQLAGLDRLPERCGLGGAGRCVAPEGQRVDAGDPHGCPPDVRLARGEGDGGGSELDDGRQLGSGEAPGHEHVRTQRGAPQRGQPHPVDLQRRGRQRLAPLGLPGGGVAAA
jgi:hypothetical protein